MKQLILAASGTLALMSGAAYAGGEGGCAYGKHLAQQAEAAQSPVLAAVDEAEAGRLAQLKALEDESALDKLAPAPVTFN